MCLLAYSPVEINIKDFLDISVEAKNVMKKIMLVDDEKDQIYFIKTSFEKLFGKEYMHCSG